MWRIVALVVVVGLGVVAAVYAERTHDGLPPRIVVARGAMRQFTYADVLGHTVACDGGHGVWKVPRRPNPTQLNGVYNGVFMKVQFILDGYVNVTCYRAPPVSAAAAVRIAQFRRKLTNGRVVGPPTIQSLNCTLSHHVTTCRGQGTSAHGTVVYAIYAKFGPAANGSAGECVAWATLVRRSPRCSYTPNRSGVINPSS